MQVTAISFLAGILAAWAGTSSSYYFSLLAAFLMETSHVLDCVDGELARLTGRGNPFAASMDPISDRLKDIAVLYSASYQSSILPPFGLSFGQILTVSFFSLGMWLFYIYVVDSFLNPLRKKNENTTPNQQQRIYLGLYDIFIYGSIIFWIFDIFRFFILFILVISFFGSIIQIFRLRKLLHPT